MYAWVAYVDGKKAIVPTSAIRHFDPNDYDNKKKYNVLWEEDGDYYDAVVLSVKETREAVELETHKRPSIPNFSYCASASELSDAMEDHEKSTLSTMAANASVIKKIVATKLAGVNKRRTKQLKTEAVAPKVIGKENIAKPNAQVLASSSSITSERTERRNTKESPRSCSTSEKKIKTFGNCLTKKTEPLAGRNIKTTLNLSNNGRTTKNLTTVAKATDDTTSNCDSGTKVHTNLTPVGLQKKIVLNNNNGELVFDASDSGVKRTLHKSDSSDPAKRKKTSIAEAQIDDPTTSFNNETKSQSAKKKSVPKIISDEVMQTKIVPRKDNRNPVKDISDVGQTKMLDKSRETTPKEKDESLAIAKKTTPKSDGRSAKNALPIPKDNSQPVNNCYDEKSVAQIEGLTHELKRFKDANAALTKRCKEKEKLIVEQQTEIDNLHVLNADSLRVCMDLQNKVITKWDDMCAIVRDMKQRSEETFTRDGNHPPVGYENKEEDKTHIGYGIWLATPLFDTLMSHKNPRLFTKEAARVIYGKQVLLKSTVTGKVSNRSKNKPNNPNELNPSALDPKKLNAISAFLEYFLNHPRFRSLSTVTKNTHVFSMGSYIGQCIADLKKAHKNEERVEACNPLIRSTSSCEVSGIFHREENFEEAVPHNNNDQYEADGDVEDKNKQEQYGEDKDREEPEESEEDNVQGKHEESEEDNVQEKHEESEEDNVQEEKHEEDGDYEDSDKHD